ncbi:MAG: helix-turn-helix domain-containing protein [Patescibacteria group bacterium]
MRLTFKEKSLGPNFVPETLKKVKEYIDRGTSFVLMSMPGVGASYFLKYLATTNLAYFIHVDFYELPNLTQHEFYKLLLYRLGGKPKKESDEQLFIKAKSLLYKISEKQKKVVIIFNRFDQLKKEFDWNFLSNIQSLSTLAPGKIVLIFTSTKPLIEIAPEALQGGNLTFYSKVVYFKPYTKAELKKLLKIEPQELAEGANIEKLLEASGGHNQLFRILLNSHKQQNLLLDQFVKTQLKALIDYLDYSRKKQIQKIALGKKVEDIDDYLLGVGMIKKTDKGYKLFTPLLAEYIKSNFPLRLPPKEAKLFKLLRNNIGRVVSKDEIFATVWDPSTGSGQEGATDWALDALIYRLRKHHFITSHGYIIESHKKVGYSLIQT